MIIGIPKERTQNEKRVAGVPEVIKRWKREGNNIIVESGAGVDIYISDKEYKDAGAELVDTAKDVFENSELILKVRAPLLGDGTNRDELEALREGSVLICFLQPFANIELIKRLAERNITSFAMELIPRITRAQPMDAMTSQSMIAGYRAVLFAAERLPKFMPLMMTAAMTVRPAKALVIGAGVAGLQAIATARRLGAIVKGVDTRPAVKEQVESLGASFVALPVHEEAETRGGYARDLGEEFYRKEQEFIEPHLIESDIVITTAQIPGRKAPVLITEGMVNKMKPGSVIVDLAIETGGNCSLSKPGEIIQKNGVTIFGFANAPSSMPYQASLMYGKNIDAFLHEILDGNKLKIDFDNEIIRETIVTYNGEIVNKTLLEVIKKQG